MLRPWEEACFEIWFWVPWLSQQLCGITCKKGKMWAEQEQSENGNIIAHMDEILVTVRFKSQSIHGNRESKE